jgi:micrococcal nuclease
MNLFYYRLRSWTVIDGDTLDAVIDVGLDVRVSQRVRLMGINTPESHSRTPESEKALGLEAKRALVRYLQRAETGDTGEQAFIQTHKIRRRSGEIDERTGKYGRYMVTLWVRRSDGSLLDINRHLVEQGYANLYTGGKRPALGTWEWAGKEQLE